MIWRQVFGRAFTYFGRVLVWCGVNRMIIDFSKASILPSISFSIHPDHVWLFRRPPTSSDDLLPSLLSDSFFNGFITKGNLLLICEWFTVFALSIIRWYEYTHYTSMFCCEHWWLCPSSRLQYKYTVHMLSNNSKCFKSLFAIWMSLNFRRNEIRCCWRTSSAVLRNRYIVTEERQI